jgi:hypothetical protein
MSERPHPYWFIPLLCQTLLNDKSVNNRILAAQTLIALEQLTTEAVDALAYAVAEDPDDTVRASIILAIQTRYTTQSFSMMPESTKVQMVFNAPVYGAAGTVQGDQNIQPAE